MKLVLRSFWTRAVVVLALVALAIYYPVVVGKVPLPHNLALNFPAYTDIGGPTSARSYATIGDLVTQAYPFRYVSSSSIRDGILPLWNPHILLGSPFIANSQSALFYPPNWLAVVLPLATAWGVGLILRMLLASMFMTLFIRSVGGSRGGSIVSGILFGACGFITAWQGWAMGDAAVWLPLICYSVHRLNASPGPGSVALMSIVFAMPVLAGHPETAMHTTWVGIGMALMICIANARAHQNVGWFVLLFTLAGLGALGLASIQMLPTLEWLRELTPFIGRRWPALSMREALGLVSRDILHTPTAAGLYPPEHTAYLAMITFPAAALAIFHSSRRYVVMLFVLAVVSFCGAYSVGPIHDVISNVPLLQDLKNGRLTLVLNFALCGLAGLGISVVHPDLIRRRRLVLTAISAAAAIPFTLAYWLYRYGPAPEEMLRRPSLALGLLAVSMIAILWRLSGRLNQNAFVAIAACISAFDLVTFAHGYTGFADRVDLYPRAPVFDFLATNTPESYRVAAVGGQGPYAVNTSMMYGFQSLEGYDLPLYRPHIFTQGMRTEDVGIGLSEASVLLEDRRMDLLNVKFLVASKGDPAYRSLETSDRYSLVFESKDVAVFENETVLPRAFLVPAASIEVIEDADRQLERLTDPSFNPAEEVIVAEMPDEVTSFNQEQDFPFTNSVEAMDTGAQTMSWRTTTSEPAILVVSQSYYPGWRAHVDGDEVDVIPVNIALTGIAIPAGTHEIRLEMNSVTFNLGALITLASTLAIAGMLIGSRAVAERRLAWAPALTVASGLIAISTAGLVIREGEHAVKRNIPPSVQSVSQVPVRLGNRPTSINISGVGTEVLSGYAQVRPPDEINVSSLTLLKYIKNGVVMSEAALPSTALSAEGAVPFETNERYRTALVMVNPGMNSVHVNTSFSGRPSNGFTIGPNEKIVAFVDEPPFLATSSTGLFMWESTEPLSFASLLTYTGRDHPFLMAPVRVSTRAPGPQYIAYDLGAGELRRLVLSNTTETVLRGFHKWYSRSGELTTSIPYSIAAQSVYEYIATPNFPNDPGWIEITPSTPQAAPSATLVSLMTAENQLQLVTVSGEPATTAGKIYSTRSADAVTVVVLTNPAGNVAEVDIGGDTVAVAPRSSVTVPMTRSGVIPVHASSPVAITVVRNAVGGATSSLMTTYSAHSDFSPIIPHFSAGGDFRTDVIVWSDEGRVAQGTLTFIDGRGTPMSVPVQR